MPIELSSTGLLPSVWHALPGSLWPMVLALVCSHGYSALRFHFGHGAWRSANSALLMMKPYGRVILLHLTLLGSGFVIHRHGESLVLLVLLVLMKIVLDLVLHVWSHREPAPRFHAVKS